MRAIQALLLITLLTGCQSLELRNLGKSGASTAIAYGLGGAIPAIGVLATSVIYDEVIPQQDKIVDIETKEQAVAYVFEKAIVWSAIGFIAFLLISLIFAPIMTKRWGYNQAKLKYKDQPWNIRY